MSAPSPLTGRGRGVARRWGFRQKPIRRPGAEALEDIGEPDFTYPDPPGRRRTIPPGEPDPARARWVRLVLDDPAAARRERVEKRLQYWRARLRKLEERLAAAEQDLDAALNPSPGEDGPAPPVPAVELFRLRVERLARWADVQHARARLEECERELAMEENDGCNASG